MVKLINSYQPIARPADLPTLLDPQRPFDLNFCFPVKSLESDKLKLTPFVPALHLELYQTRTLQSSDVFRYVAYGPFHNLQEAANFFDSTAHSDRGCVFFTIVDKTRSDEHDLGGAFAGVISLLNSSSEQSQSEIGHITILPSFQKTHVNTHAVGLLLQYLLELPTATVPGLGLRRAQWRTHSLNTRSAQAAERMGFKLEGIERWHRVLPEGKEGQQSRQGDPLSGPARHSVLLSLCWDDWDNGGRDHVVTLMKR